MGFLSSGHPHTSITDTINRLTDSETYDLEVEIGTLIGSIKTRDKYQYNENQQEAARALRKKLKYGNKLEQSKALDIIDLFISQNIRFTILYNDSKLIDRLLVIGTEYYSNKSNSGTSSTLSKKHSIKIIKKCIRYAISWNEFIISNNLQDSNCYISLYDATNRIKQVYTELNKKNKKTLSSSSNFMNDSADESIFGDGSQYLNNADRLYRIPKIDLQREAPKIKLIISDSLAASTALENSLMILPQGDNALKDRNSTECFIKARNIRRKVLRYLQLVTEGEFLGSLIHANDELVNALTLYDEKSWDETDDSDDDSDDVEASNYNENIYDSDDSDDNRSNARNNNTPSFDPFGDHNQI